MKKIIFTLISVFMFVGCVNNINDIEEPAPVEPTPIENEEESPELESNQFNCEGIDWDKIQQNGTSGLHEYYVNVVLTFLYPDNYNDDIDYNDTATYDNDKHSYGNQYKNPHLWYSTFSEEFIIQFKNNPTFTIKHENNIATITYYENAEYNEDNTSITKVSYDKESNTLTIELEYHNK